MKILFVSRLYMPHIGGVEIHLREISTILIRMGHEVTIITGQDDKKLRLETNYKGIQVYRIPYEATGNKQKTWNEIKKYSYLFDDVDVVHVHDVFWWILPVYFKIKKKVYLTFHGWETKLPIPINSKIHRFLVSQISLKTIHVGNFIQEFYWDKPNQVIYGGINLKRFTKSNNKTIKHIIKSNKLRFVFVGRLDVDTDIKLYINFLKKLQYKKINFDIIWVGDGALKKQCEEFGEVTGFQKNISKYIVNSDFVFSSSYLSILESLCLEKIILSFYSNPLKKRYLELFPGYKYLLVSGSVDGMLKKLEHLLTSRKLLASMQKDAGIFAKKYTWEKVVATYLKLWKY
jgi:glycosyltransferase involved in cell wall biosynthesis